MTDSLLRFDHFMAKTLSGTEGYYRSGNPFGAQGDFTTSPQISSLFGQTVGLWVLTTWQRLGKPPHLTLMELGPGTGQMMADIVSILHAHPTFTANLQIIFIDINKDLQPVQNNHILSFGYPVTWADHIDHSLYETMSPLIILANEFFDALPVRQIHYHGPQNDPRWTERYVDMTSRTFVDRPFAIETPDIPSPWNAFFHRWILSLHHPTIIEFSIHQLDMLDHMVKGVKACNGGAIWLCDYGYVHGSGDTIQGMQHHKMVSPLIPGSDITAHVNFSVLQDMLIKSHGLFPILCSQRDFLTNHGIHAMAHKSSPPTKTTKDAIDHLTNPHRMGELFKVLTVGIPPRFP